MPTDGTDTALLTRGPLQIGKYELVRPLGQGAMGLVYHAFDPTLQRDVAIKVMAAAGARIPQLAERFVGEARAVARLAHPNVVAVYDLGEDGTGAPYIVMELLRGQDLEQALHEGPALDLAARVDVVLQVLEGLAQAHRAGIVHRDVKPANVFLCRDGTAKIMDFGVARLAEARLTEAGMIVGTVGYMSPEQAKGETIDARSDLFSVGCLLFELLTRRRPFEAPSPMAVLFAITHADPDWDLVPAGPEYSALLPIVKKAMARDPALRFGDAEQFAASLREWRTSWAPTGTPSADRRLHPRLRLDLPVRVEGWDEGNLPWVEETVTEDASITGASVLVAHAVQPGCALHLSLSLPRQFRMYDLETPVYSVWGLVRSVHESRVGILFLGAEPPAGFEEQRGGRFVLPSDQSGTQREFPRFELTVNMRLRKVERWGSEADGRAPRRPAPAAEEWTVTEDLGQGGAGVRATLELRKGEVVDLEEVGGAFRARCEVLSLGPFRAGYRRANLAFLDPEAPGRVRELLRRHGIVIAGTAGMVPRQRLLLVEGDPERRRVLTAMLERARCPAYEVEVRDSLGAALSRVREGDLDVVVAAVGALGDEELDAVSRFVETSPRLPVLGIASRAEERAVIEGLRRGLHDVLDGASFDEGVLTHRLRSALERRGHGTARAIPVSTPPLKPLPDGGLPALFRGLYVGRRTGLLTVASAEERRHVRFRGGHIVGASSTVKEERLGDVLVRRGLVAADDVRRATAVVIREGRRLGAVFLQLGILTPEALEEAVSVHAREVLARILGLVQRGWSFRDEEVPALEDVTLKISTAEIILDSVRGLGDPVQVRRALGDRHRVLRPSSDPLLRYQRVNLDATEGYVLSRIDGVLDVAAIIALVPIAPEKTERIVLALLSTGLVEDVPRDERRRPAAKVAPLDDAGGPTERVRRRDVLEAWRSLGTRDHFEILGVPRDADDSAIRQAYGRLARRFHPDAHHDPALADLGDRITDVFIRTQQAFEALRDPQLRAAYRARLTPRPATARDEASTTEQPEPAFLVAQAERLLAADRTVDAVRLLEDVLPRARGHVLADARLLLARGYERHPMWRHEAVAVLQELIRDEPNHAEARAAIARLGASEPADARPDVP